MLSARTVMGLVQDHKCLILSLRPRISVMGGRQDIGVARQEVVRILGMGYADTMPTKWLVLLIVRSSREPQPDAERNVSKEKLLPD